jgi:two-component system, chemotaxis family, sensor kinase CheA
VNDLQEQFVTEARDLIAQASDDLIALERDGLSPARIDRIFRAFHTLKGSAGVVELPAMSMMLHAAEDLLAGVRDGTLEADAKIVDVALACLDLVSRWVDDFEVTGALPVQASDDGRAMAGRLRSFLPNGAGERPAPVLPDDVKIAGEGALPAWASHLIAELSPKPERPLRRTAILYEPIAGCFFNGDDPLELMRKIPDLLAIHIETREPFAPLSELDPYNCNVRLQAISAGAQDEIARIFRLVPDQMRIFDVPPEVPAIATGGGLPGDDDLVRKVLKAQCEMLRIADRRDGFAGCVGSAARAATNALRHGGHLQPADAVRQAGALAAAQESAGPLLSALEQALAALDSPSPALIGHGPGQPSDATSGVAGRPVDRVLRVSEAKIENLINLAGELVVAKNALAHSARQVEDGRVGPEVARSILRDRDAIDRLVTELHGSVLQLRMVPAAHLFRSFPRLIRDVARQLDKNVVLVTRGETTEADKTVMDRLFEPMVHLVRNALDHGVEVGAERQAAGKPEIATISIVASRIGDRLLIEVTDDGRGIDPAVVRRKAAQQQLLMPDELDGLTDEQVVDLVFSAGFSTASAVSDISGRGIGMDVVRTAIEQMGGRVTLESKIGAGTTARLDLPMTIAMSRIMVIETGGQLFGISMDAVSETVRVTPDRISRIKNNDGFVLRDRVVPIASLAARMKLPEQKRDRTAERLLMVVEAAGKIAAFEIDAVKDRLDVVLKPMQGLLEGVRGFAGTTLLGNGQVLLVLDVKEMLQ